MSISVLKRICLSCGSVLHGRVDKKFCNDYCRNNYNNEQKAARSNNATIKNISKAILNNRKILEGLLKSGEETTSVGKEKLLRLGFQFRYLTEVYTTRAGKNYFYCYDYGYLPLENDRYLIVRKIEDRKE